MGITATESYSFEGSYDVSGGRSHSETGGSGTAYVYETNADTGETTSRLFVDNSGYRPLSTYITDKASDSARTYIVNTADMGISRYDFDHVTLTGAGHLAFTTSVVSGAEVHVNQFHGDQTGFVHVQSEVSVNINASDTPFPSAFKVYDQGQFSTPTGK